MDTLIINIIFLYINNSYESGYDPRVTSFYPLSDPLTSYEFYNIDSKHICYDRVFSYQSLF